MSSDSSSFLAGLIMGGVAIMVLINASPVGKFGKCYVQNKHNELVADVVVYCEGKANLQEYFGDAILD